MNTRFKKHFGDFLFCLLSLTGVVILFIPVSTVNIIRAEVSSFLAPMFALLSPPQADAASLSSRNAGDTAMENLELKAENARLKYQLDLVNECEEGRETLKNLNISSEEGGIQGKNAIAATLIARPVYKARALYVLDKGTCDGVTVGSGVMCRGIAVGKVVAAADRVSLMAPVTHCACQIPAWIAELNVGGQLQGADDQRGRRSASLKFVPRRESVQPGMRVVTSGLDGAFPAGVLIGLVARIVDQDAAFHDITVEAALPAQYVREVWILPRRFIPLIHEKQGDVDAMPNE
jgi:rod shape-determining protein MreC